MNIDGKPTSAEFLSHLLCACSDLPLKRTRVFVKIENGVRSIEVRSILEGVGFFARRRIRRHFEWTRKNYQVGRAGLLSPFSSYHTISDPRHAYGNRYHEFRMVFQVHEQDFPRFVVDKRYQIVREGPLQWFTADILEEISEPHNRVA